ncbi:MAG: GHMP kinase, partial [Candidatus Acidiferrales bacterium]
MRLHASAPTRIDLAGGTLDIWPLYLFHPGALTLNLAISRLARCLLEPRADRRIVLINRDTGRREAFASLRALQKQGRYRLPLPAHMVRFFAPSHGLTLTTWSEVPAGSGLGGSSALAVAIGAAFCRWLGRRLSRQELVFLGRDTDARVLGVPTGEQDHYPAAFGGVNAIRLEPLGTRCEPLAVDLRALESRLLLVYTGEPRRSGINNWDVVKRYLDGDRRLRRNFSQIAATAAAMRQALVKENWKELARLLRHEWRTR